LTYDCLIRFLDCRYEFNGFQQLRELYELKRSEALDDMHRYQTCVAIFEIAMYHRSQENETLLYKHLPSDFQSWVLESWNHYFRHEDHDYALILDTKQYLHEELPESWNDETT